MKKLTLDDVKDNVLSEKEALVYLLIKNKAISQRELSDATGLSRDTIRRITDKATAILE